ncbi:hypothetical protein KCTC52924_03340 [Arenibacter antarcticus]|uniref:Uncharacterized protein n=1 Tax=Arenibacter antarcticus TaxID=2040469 RepID=A0ABW5VIZ9_9FLAO|nr:hypothetical protein [Arenibacter sp. H213]MCM4166407.1 hypothetical protein [Arenibacter sp. H213]
MKRIHFSTLVSLLFISVGAIAQAEKANKIENRSYYEQRAIEDAKYEQTQQLDKDAEEDFWEDQKEYDRKLKKRDKKAYKAYLKGKRDAYSEHRQHCDSHCHHSQHYHSYASFYYYNNAHYGNHRPHNRTTIRTGVGVRMPSVRIGL